MARSPRLRARIPRSFAARYVHAMARHMHAYDGLATGHMHRRRTAVRVAAFATMLWLWMRASAAATLRSCCSVARLALPYVMTSRPNKWLDFLGCEDPVLAQHTEDIEMQETRELKRRSTHLDLFSHLTECAPGLGGYATYYLDPEDANQAVVRVTKRAFQCCHGRLPTHEELRAAMRDRLRARQQAFIQKVRVPPEAVRRVARAILHNVPASKFPYREFHTRSSNARRSAAYRSTGKPPALSACAAVTITCYYLGHLMSYKDVAEEFGLPVATTFAAINYTLSAINARGVVDRFIVWPSTPAAVNKSCATIATKTGKNRAFSRCMGAVDGTHFPVKAPVMQQYILCNRKGWYSTNTQV